MKKYLTLTFLILTVALSYYFMNNSTFSKSELQLSEVEALSDCEIYKPDGTLIKKCIGKEPVCHTISESKSIQNNKPCISQQGTYHADYL